MFEMPQKTESRHTGSILFIVLAIILLAAGVLFIAFACRSYFRYRQYGRAVEYTFGSTSQVVATLEDGTRVRLSDHNRTVLYSMLTDSSGQRHESGGETGDSFEFYASSAVGTAAATVADAGDGWVYLHMEYEDESWDYYFQNRSDYDMWLRAVSPDGWLEPNTVLKNKVG